MSTTCKKYDSRVSWYMIITIQVPDQLRATNATTATPFISAPVDTQYRLLWWINNQIRFFAWMICIVVLIYGWYQLITARWDPKATEKAKTILLWAWIGIGITIFSYSVVKLIVNFIQ